MKQFLRTSTFIVGLLLSVKGFSQAIFSTENFPNNCNASGTLGYTGSFSGNQGVWNITSTSIFDIEADNTRSMSSPNSIRIFVNSGSASATIGNNAATSPAINLNFGTCLPTNVSFEFNLLVVDVDNSNSDFTLGLQFYDGSVWSTVWSKTSNNVFDDYGMSTSNWRNISLTVPPIYWTPNFKYRFFAVKNSTAGTNNSTELWIDDVNISSTTLGPDVPNFSGAATQISGSVNGSYDVGDVFRYTNAVASPFNINAEVAIEAISNARVVMLDNNAAGVAQRFQPQIGPNPQNMTTDQEGYIQFAITFRKASDNSVVSLTNLRYRQFDMDGNASGTQTFRETSWITGNPIPLPGILVNAPTNLTDAGSLPNGGYTWRKILGASSEHAGITSDPDVYYTATYLSVSVVRFRMGYQFVKGTGGNMNVDFREFAAEFGCFNIAANVPLPVKLISFSGNYRTPATYLNWETENEVNFDHFEIERSFNGNNFASIGSKQAGNGAGRLQYQSNDDLSGITGNTFYYRLKMVDKDGASKYSNVILIRKDQKSINGISINPNPVTNGTAILKLTASVPGSVELRVMDMTGKIVLKQQNKVYEGNNTLAVNNLDRLQPGIYTMQLLTSGDIFVSKFSIVR